MREELHHLVDELPEAEVQPVLELIRGRADAAHGLRDLPFFASFESDPDLAERSEEILRAELGRCSRRSMRSTFDNGGLWPGAARQVADHR